MNAYISHTRTSIYLSSSLEYYFFFFFYRSFSSLKYCSRRYESKENTERVLRRTAILVISPLNTFLLSLLYQFFLIYVVFLSFFLALSLLPSLLSSFVFVVLFLPRSSSSFLYDQRTRRLQRNSNVVVFAVALLLAVFLVYLFANIYVKNNKAHQNQ